MRLNLIDILVLAALLALLLFAARQDLSHFETNAPAESSDAVP